MSKKKKTAGKKDTDRDSAAEDATFESVAEEVAETEAPDAAQADAAKDTRSRKTGVGLVAWLSLLIACAALVAFGVDFMRERAAAEDALANDAAMRSLSSSIRALENTLDTLQQNVTALSEQRASQQSAIDELTRSLNERLQQIESIHGRLSVVEGTVSSLQGISTGARDAWLLAEAEYYMQIANAQLQLAGNPQLAKHALELADERILQLANPALTDVRRALSNELRALELMDRTDVAGVTLRLASLAQQVDSLPLRLEVGLADGSDAAVDPELSGTDRALASLRNAFSSAVSVRRTDESLEPLVAPEAQYFLRANLALQLQAARLAVLRGEEAVFRQSLDDAADWLGEYYQTDAGSVQSVLQAIGEIRGSVFSQTLPDISESLRLLRKFNALAEARAAPAVETQEDRPAEPEQ